MSAFRNGSRERRLADCSVTHHALDSYLTRVPEARAGSARSELAEVARAATFVRRLATGEEIWRAVAHGRGLRLVIHRVARRAPQVLTVIAEEAPGGV